MTFLEKGDHDMRADEASCASDQDEHFGNIKRSLTRRELDL